MMTDTISTDYLILGAGAMAIAFADVILHEDKSATVVMVDRRAGPGGHWNNAYPFVRLHQPAAFYGLNTTTLGQGGTDLASGAEIVAYYKAALDRFSKTGRFRFLGMSEYQGNGRVVSVLDAERVVEVTAKRRVVDGTYMEVQVPATTPPRYAVATEVPVIPPNDLVEIREPRDRYVIVGAGKTGTDAILFLLDQGVPPKRVQWIAPNDAWLWDRATMQPGNALGTIVSLVRSIADESTIDRAFLRLESEEILCRVDTDVRPTKWRCATVDRAELSELRRVDDVVRLGRVERITEDRIELEQGSVDLAANSVVVDCSANGLRKDAVRPVFSPGDVTLQSVFMCQQTFSAALLAHLELTNVSDAHRNQLCVPVPHPELTEDLPDALLVSIQNMLRCHRRIPLWLRRSRLYLGHHDSLPNYLANSGKLALLLRPALTSSRTMGTVPSASVRRRF